MTWPVTVLLAICLLACGDPRLHSRVARPVGGKVRLLVLDDGFHPNHIVVRAGEPLSLTFQLRARRPCLRKLVIYLDERHKLTKSLRFGEETEVGLRFARRGQTGFACGMAMFGGTIDVE